RSIEPAHHLKSAVDGELTQNIASDGGCRCCGQGQHRRWLQFPHCVAQTQIVRTKIVTPKRNTVRFVDGTQTCFRAAQTGTKFLTPQALRSDIEQLDASCDGLLQPASLLLTRDGAVDQCGG